MPTIKGGFKVVNGKMDAESEKKFMEAAKDSTVVKLMKEKKE